MSGTPEVARQPNLLFFVGTRVSAPLGLGEVVAKNLGMDYLSVESVRRSVLQLRAQRGELRTKVRRNDALEHVIP